MTKHQKMWIGASAIAAVIALATAPAADMKGEVALRAALEQETVKGDLKGAIEQYKKIVAAYPQNRPLAARALFHIGECYEKLGQAEAEKAYERLVREYPEQKEAGEARARLGAREPAAHASSDVTVQRLWAGDDVDLEGNLTPDGRYLVFSDWKSGGNVAVRDLRTGENRDLTHDAGWRGWATNLMFSPDAKSILYQWERNDESIRQINIDGTHMREIVHMPYGIYVQAWSPDGKQIAAVHTNHRGDWTYQIVLISVADGSMRRLKSTGWQWPSIGGFSPDGRLLVYSLQNSRSKTDGGIFAIAADGSRETLLLQSTTGDAAPAWTPDGRAIVFVSDRSGTKDLWSIRVAHGRLEGAPERLRAQVGSIEPKGFARDGSLFYGTRQLDTDVYTAEFDPDKLTVAPPVRITEQFIGSNYAAEPSPDGKEIAFLRRPPGELNSGNATLLVRSVATGDERSLATGVRVYWRSRGIRWYPDSRSLLLEDSENNRKRFRRIDIATGEARTVYEGPYEIWTTAELSRDGKTLFYSISSKENQRILLRLLRRDLETGREKELYRTESPGIGCFGLTLSQDGERLAFMVNVGTDTNGRAILTLPATGGTAREIYRGTFENTDPWGGVMWTKDDRYVIVSGKVGTTHQRSFWAIPLEQGEPRQLGPVMEDLVSPSLSPDGRHIVFTGSRRKSELWVIRNFLPQLQASR